jgi:hypothetical protein
MRRFPRSRLAAPDLAMCDRLLNLAAAAPPAPRRSSCHITLQRPARRKESSLKSSIRDNQCFAHGNNKPAGCGRWRAKCAKWVARSLVDVRGRTPTALALRFHRSSSDSDKGFHAKGGDRPRLALRDGSSSSAAAGFCKSAAAPVRPVLIHINPLSIQGWGALIVGVAVKPYRLANSALPEQPVPMRPGDLLRPIAAHLAWGNSTRPAIVANPGNHRADAHTETSSSLPARKAVTFNGQHSPFVEIDGKWSRHPPRTAEMVNLICTQIGSASIHHAFPWPDTNAAIADILALCGTWIDGTCATCNNIIHQSLGTRLAWIRSGSMTSTSRYPFGGSA